eukprot:5748589-Amphidinium_carterae.2
MGTALTGVRVPPPGGSSYPRTGHGLQHTILRIACFVFAGMLVCFFTSMDYKRIIAVAVNTVHGGHCALLAASCAWGA